MVVKVSGVQIVFLEELVDRVPYPVSISGAMNGPRPPCSDGRIANHGRTGGQLTQDTSNHPTRLNTSKRFPSKQQISIQMAKFNCCI